MLFSTPNTQVRRCLLALLAAASLNPSLDDPIQPYTTPQSLCCSVVLDLSGGFHVETLGLVLEQAALAFSQSRICLLGAEGIAAG